MTERKYRRVLLRMLPIGVGAMLATPIGGVSLLVGTGGGLYWAIATLLLAFTAALADAWGAANRDRPLMAWS